MRVTTCVACFLAVALSLCPTVINSQLSGRPPSIIETLNKEAEATDPEGIHRYSDHLTQLLTNELELGDKVGPSYTESLSNRLAKAEESARKGKRKLISEKIIADAFNDLMRRTAAPSLFNADVADVEKSRKAFEKELPAVISEGENGDYCNPGESVWVMEMLIENIGVSTPRLTQSGPKVSGANAPVRRHLMQYFSSHSRNETINLLDRLTNDLGI